MAYPGGGIKVGCAALLKSCLEATPEALATRQTEMQHLRMPRAAQWNQRTIPGSAKM